MMHHRIHPEAEQEADAALEWYGEIDPALGLEFARIYHSTIGWIVDRPRLYPLADDSPDEVECRNSGHLGRFPDRIVYAVFGDEILFVAVAHHHRKPGYWRDRLLDS